jgi:hypothetical protein
MVTEHDSGRDACTPLCRPPRHTHPSPDLNAAGVPCPCGSVNWSIMSGAPLPAAVACLTCYAQSDLEAVLLRNGRQRWG